MGLLFFAFDDQPHLAFVTRTVVKAGNHLINFSIVWTCTLLSFTSSAWMMFGETSDEFETIGTTMLTLYRCMYGEFPDFHAFVDTGFDWISIPFFIVFTIVFLLLLLNIVLAVLIDAYSSMNISMQVHSSIWLYVHDALLFYRNRAFHRYIPLNTVLRGVRQYVYDIAPQLTGDTRTLSSLNLESGYLLDETVLKSILPNMQEEQVMELLIAAGGHTLRTRKVLRKHEKPTLFTKPSSGTIATFTP